MKRIDFIKRTVLGSAGIVATGLSLSAFSKKRSTHTQLMKGVGFNHLPPKNDKKMNTVLHKAATRGEANHGWLKSKHTFSFANYYNPERMHFGVLRVLNDDFVEASKGFSRHSHDNMEIISIPLSGGLEHKDSMGNIGIIRKGDVQVMSAGTGVFHSEYNKNDDQPVQFLQIWIFPNQKNVKPRYDQITLNLDQSKNKWNQILSPNPEDEGVWIHQNAWFHIGEFNKTHTVDYTIKRKENGVYIFVLEGKIKVEDTVLEKRDGFGIWNTEKINIMAEKGAKVLLIDVPME